MQSLLLLLAKEMPEENLLEKLSEAIEAHKIAPTEKTKESLAFYCSLMATRFATEGRDTFDVIKEFEQRKDLIKAFEGTKIG